MSTDSTFKDVRDEAQARSPWARRIGTVLLAGLVLIGASGLLGVRLASATVAEDGVTITVEYAQIARLGNGVPMVVTVVQEGGFSAPIDIAIDPDYLSMFDSQRFVPEPSEETRDGDWLLFTFDAPEGETFVFEFDAYLEPGWQFGHRGTVGLMEEGRLVAPVEFRTTVLL